MTSSLTKESSVERFCLSGMVQGQGVRPTVARIATQLGLHGSVCNTAHGVEVLAAGTSFQIDRFESELRRAIDAKIDRRTIAEHDTIRQYGKFEISETKKAGVLQTDVPVDLATCRDCLAEFNDPENRRYRYPFISCTQCGPRYSIVSRMPFDRDSTAMRDFPLCDRCRAEYENPNDRRFHAQTIACADCGPRCWSTDGNGNRTNEGASAIELVARQISNGKLAAVLGLGGYQLICDASSDAVVSELRVRKSRPSKPLPIACIDVEFARQFAAISDTENRALRDPSNPIVILRSRNQTSLSRHLATGMNSIGVMLPTTPIHLQLLRMTNRPLVMTSGNLHGSPLAYRTESAIRELGSVADVFLHHDRRVTRPIDDSVVQCVGTQTMTIRAGRGLAPMAFDVRESSTAIAVGGHQKVAPALKIGTRAVLGPHIGDMETESSRRRFEQATHQMRELYDVETYFIPCDLHPGYFTTSWSNRQANSPIAIQHHHAHVAASMLEHELADDTVLGIAFDGTGFGDDATLWGGECLVTTTSDYQRVGHLRKFRLPGSELAIEQPWRSTASMLTQIEGNDFIAKWLRRVDASFDAEALSVTVEQGPETSSVGRLFDAIASLVLGIKEVSFEGEAAMRLEAICDLSESNAYSLIVRESMPWQLDWRPMLRAILDDMNSVSVGRIAMRFHRAVANAVIEIASMYANLPCLLTGGVFQNRTLIELIHRESKRRGLDIRLPRLIPINDGGLAVGQLAVASAVERRDVSCV